MIEDIADDRRDRKSGRGRVAIEGTGKMIGRGYLPGDTLKIWTIGWSKKQAQDPSDLRPRWRVRAVALRPSGWRWFGWDRGKRWGRVQGWVWSWQTEKASHSECRLLILETW